MLQPHAPTVQPLPRFDDDDGPERYPYGARSEAAVYVGELLHAEVAALSESAGSLEIVAIARRPGVLSKVAIRPRHSVLVPVSDAGTFAAFPEPRPAIGIGGDELKRVTQQLDGERIDIVRWQRSAAGFIADALGLGEVPPMLLLPGIGHARVLLGEIDLRGIAGWRGLNVVLASALTGWRIRLEPVSATAGWQRLASAVRDKRRIVASVVGPSQRGVRLEMLGLYAILSGTREHLSPGQELEVRITRMDPDEGRIFVSDRTSHLGGQLALPL